jgi:hypothetical protein
MFTLNNPEGYKPELEWKDEIKFLVYQLEKGKEETLHLQGYVQFTKNKRLAALKKLCPRAHWEKRQGSHEQAKAYCTKEDTRQSEPVMVGEEPAPGKRNDLDAVKKLIDTGASWKQVADEHFTQFVKYERGLRSYSSLTAKPRDFKTEVIVLYGPTGTGKSLFCRTNAPDAYWYFPQKDGKWWDGYEGEDDIVIDEFYGQLQWSAALRLFDRYPCQVEVKGRTINFAPKRIFITSNKEPYYWYPSKGDQFQTLNRRLDKIYNLPELGIVQAVKLPVPPPVPELNELMHSDAVDIPAEEPQFVDPFDAETQDDSLESVDPMVDVDDSSDKENTPPSNVPTRSIRSLFIDDQAEAEGSDDDEPQGEDAYDLHDPFIDNSTPVQSPPDTPPRKRRRLIRLEAFEDIEISNENNNQ